MLRKPMTKEELQKLEIEMAQLQKAMETLQKQYQEVKALYEHAKVSYLAQQAVQKLTPDVISEWIDHLRGKEHEHHVSP